MFTDEQVKLVVGETLVSTHVVMATMFDLEAGIKGFTVADVIAAVLDRDEDAPLEERTRLVFKNRRQAHADGAPPE